ncbi:hypothetical protein ACROYT_G029885 [Oculina patagonica]
MAESSAKVAKMARILAMVHIIVGFLLICFGIADRLVEYIWTGYGYFGVWIGIWMCVTGGLGIPGTSRERNSSRCAFSGVFMGFPTTSAVLGAVIIGSYSTVIALYRDGLYYNYYDYEYNRYDRRNSSKHDTEMALSAIILILGVVEFVIGIWAAVCVCLMNPCTSCCNTEPQQGQAMYTAKAGYVIPQEPGGVPVAIPMQTGGGMVAVQTVTPGTLGGQTQIVVVPVSGAVGDQSSVAMATGYQQQ